MFCSGPCSGHFSPQRTVTQNKRFVFLPIAFRAQRQKRKRKRLARNLVPSFHYLFRQPVRKERPYRVSVLFIQCPIDTIRGTLQFVSTHVVPVASRVSLSSNCTNQMETSQVNLQPKIKKILNQVVKVTGQRLGRATLKQEKQRVPSEDYALDKVFQYGPCSLISTLKATMYMCNVFTKENTWM